MGRRQRHIVRVCHSVLWLGTGSCRAWGVPESKAGKSSGAPGVGVDITLCKIKARLEHPLTTA
eukprot:3764316-Amphidinium_carterae.2